ncbi:MAG: 5'-nucleotidase [Burkholderiaceae bacterium]|jgi:5'-nucleotidase|nr:5'-nucleotidase [Burkholderiaceae bacterium]
MPATLQDQLVVAIGSRALFDFEEENRLFEAGDAAAYMALQLERIDTPARPGVAFSLIRKLLAFNAPDAPGDPASGQRVEVVVLSRNDPVSGLRVFRSAQAHGIAVQRGVFTQGRDPFRYLKPLGAHLFLSANEADAREALGLGFPAARVAVDAPHAGGAHPHEVRIAFDGDAVLFADEAERVYQKKGLEAFQKHEKRKAALPLPEGPFKPLLAALNRLRQVAAASVAPARTGPSSPRNGERGDIPANSGPMRLRTALVTARSAPAHERAIRTLMHWGIGVDEAMFLGGLPKGEFLREFEPDFFFDDQAGHIAQAARYVPAGHVDSGVANAV